MLQALGIIGNRMAVRSKAEVVLPDGVVIGVWEGSPLSPLLSNIARDELDTELARRDHRLVRNADDCYVYVASERAAQRVMASLSRFHPVEPARANQHRQVGRGPTQNRKRSVAGAQVSAGNGSPRLWAVIRSLR